MDDVNLCDWCAGPKDAPAVAATRIAALEAQILSLAEREYAKIAALETALRGIMRAETVPVHVGYDERGNYAWADAVRLDDEAFDAARALLPDGAEAATRIAALEAALKQISDECQSSIDLYERNGPSFTSPAGHEYEPASYVQDKMRELIAAARALLTDGGDDAKG